MAVRKVKKLYFSAVLSRGGATGSVGTGAIFPCTNFRANGLYSGDSNGAVLEDFAPIAATDSQRMRNERAVSAWFQLQAANYAVAGATRGPVGFLLDFVAATTTVAAVAQIGAFGSLAAGQSTLGTRHFAVRVRPLKLSNTQNFTVHGVLYVQRQHSLEV
jgi:hypothetical protein